MKTKSMFLFVGLLMLTIAASACDDAMAKGKSVQAPCELAKLSPSDNMLAVMEQADAKDVKEETKAPSPFFDNSGMTVLDQAAVADDEEEAPVRQSRVSVVGE